MKKRAGARLVRPSADGFDREGGVAEERPSDKPLSAVTRLPTRDHRAVPLEEALAQLEHSIDVPGEREDGIVLRSSPETLRLSENELHEHLEAWEASVEVPDDAEDRMVSAVLEHYTAERRRALQRGRLVAALTEIEGGIDVPGECEDGITFRRSRETLRLSENELHEQLEAWEASVEVPNDAEHRMVSAVLEHYGAARERARQRRRRDAVVKALLALLALVVVIGIFAYTLR